MKFYSKKYFSIQIYLFILIGFYCIHCEIVKLSTGLVEGRYISTKNGKNGANAYLGVPYAEPPLGDLRFYKPVPKIPWNGILQAKHYKSACWQNASISPQDSVSEDCLHVNIFSGRNCHSGRLCPVLFYIHGGANEFDSVRMFKPEVLVENFASRDMVFTTIGYRLGVLGFWSTGTAEAPGNWMLLDLIEGLKWVQREIRHFGGDKNNVTIMGHSTGGTAVALLTVTEKSLGLFNQAIIMSESASRPKNLHNDLTDFQNLTRLVGCLPHHVDVNIMTSLDQENVVKCMRKVDASTLVNTMNELRCCDQPDTRYAEQIVNFVALERLGIELPPRIMWPRNDGPDGLFPEPLPIMRLKRRSITTMIGSTANEYGNMNPAFHGRSSPYSVAQMCDFVAQEKIFKNFEIIRRECKKNYALYAGHHEREYSRSNFSFWTRLQTSILMEYQYFAPILREVSSILQVNCSKIYLYSLDYEKVGFAGISPWHSEDLTYLMDLHRKSKFDHHDLMFREMFLQFLANFVKFGDPTPNFETSVGNGPLISHIKWSPVQCPGGSNYLSVNLSQTAMKPFYHKNCNWFWNRVAEDLENDWFNDAHSLAVNVL